MTLFGVQTTVFVIGLVLFLARNPAGRWPRGIFPLVVVAAALSAALAVLPFADAERPQP
jgi:predicted RND superfamily exporter protein